MSSNVWIQSIKFGVVGAANTSVGLAAIYAVMLLTGGNLIFSNIIGYACGILLSFALNRAWTFQSERSAREVLPKYICLFVVSYTFNLATVLFATDNLELSPYLSQLVGVLIYTILMFFGSRHFVFRPS